MRPLPPRASARRVLPRTPEREEILTVRINLGNDELQRPALKVLLLEDRADFRSVLEDHLTTSGHHVTCAKSGVEGVREVLKAPFDIIICDMMMPKMGGEMFYWAVMRVRPAARYRFIFFTGHKNNEPLEAFFGRVHATVLYKPFPLSKLDLAIEKVMHNLA